MNRAFLRMVRVIDDDAMAMPHFHIERTLEASPGGPAARRPARPPHSRLAAEETGGSGQPANRATPPAGLRGPGSA